jgi:hypothetical protein
MAAAPMAMTPAPELRIPPPMQRLPLTLPPTRSRRWVLVVVALLTLGTGAAVAYRNDGLGRLRVLIEQVNK